MLVHNFTWWAYCESHGPAMIRGDPPTGWWSIIFSPDRGAWKSTKHQDSTPSRGGWPTTSCDADFSGDVQPSTSGCAIAVEGLEMFGVIYCWVEAARNSQLYVAEEVKQCLFVYHWLSPCVTSMNHWPIWLKKRGRVCFFGFGEKHFKFYIFFEFHKRNASKCVLQHGDWIHVRLDLEMSAFEISVWNFGGRSSALQETTLSCAHGPMRKLPIMIIIYFAPLRTWFVRGSVWWWWAVW